MKKVAVVGTTSWGTTLSIMLAQRGLDVCLWARTEREALELDGARENLALLPGFPFPPGLRVTHVLSEALHQATMAILAVPSRSMRENAAALRGLLRPSCLVLSASKGLEGETAKRMSQVLADELPRRLHRNICVLSGPNLSREIARGQPASSVVAARDQDVANAARDLVMSPLFRVYTSTDLTGVELGGALKNIIAIGMGVANGLGYGENAKAAFLTRGLAEITRLGVAAGAQPLTLAGLAGMGDLVATAFSPLSRNHTLGELLARGRTLKEALASFPSTPEGVDTTVAALKLGKELTVDLPITQQTYRVLFEGLNPHQAVEELMGRPPKPEWADVELH